MLLLKRRQNNFIKDGTAAESSVWKMLLPSFLGIIVCTICLAGMTWAWFTSGVQSQSTISAKEYSLKETITVQNAKSGALEKSADGNYTLAENTTYVVKLTPRVTPKSGGYCMLRITPADGSEAVYYTQALKAETEFSFTISNGNKKATCQLIAAWGVPDVSKTANNALIDSGNVISINGGASSDASTSEPADSNQSAPATKDNKEGSSGGNSVDGTSGQDGANSQNQTDKASGTDKAGNKTNENQ